MSPIITVTNLEVICESFRLQKFLSVFQWYGCDHNNYDIIIYTLLGVSVCKPHICSFSESSCVCTSVCPYVHLTGLNIIGMRGERNMCIVYVVHAQHNATNMDRRGRRAWKEVNSACVGLNMTEKTAAETWSQSIGNVELEQSLGKVKNTNKESSRREQKACMSAPYQQVRGCY